MKKKKVYQLRMNYNQVYLSIGSNINDKLDNIEKSLKHLEDDENIKIIKTSSIYISEPLYYKKQNHFYQKTLTGLF